MSLRIDFIDCLYSSLSLSLSPMLSVVHYNGRKGKQGMEVLFTTTSSGLVNRVLSVCLLISSARFQDRGQRLFKGYSFPHFTARAPSRSAVGLTGITYPNVQTPKSIKSLSAYSRRRRRQFMRRRHGGAGELPPWRDGSPDVCSVSTDCVALHLSGEHGGDAQ